MCDFTLTPEWSGATPNLSSPKGSESFSKMSIFTVLGNDFNKFLHKNRPDGPEPTTATLNMF